MIALKGAQYLEELIESGALISNPSNALDTIYALEKTCYLPGNDTHPDTPEDLLISKAQFSEIAKEFADNDIAVLGRRAITQITKKLQNDVSKQKHERHQHEANVARADVNVNGKYGNGKRQ